MLQNKKILFIVEKPSQSEKIKDIELFKNLSLNNEINFHYAHVTIPYYSYQYQNNLKYKDLPFIGDLNYKFDVSKEDKFYKKYDKQKTNPYCLARNNLNKEFFLSYDTIVIATDYDASGFYGVYLELEQVLGEKFNTLFKDMYVINTSNMSEEWLTNELNNCLSNVEFKNERINEFYKMVNKGKIKKYFDYNYQFNLNVFVKEVYKYLFLNDFKDNKEFEEIYTNFGFTKYVLLSMFSFYYHLEQKEQKIFKCVDIHYFLFRYNGTGKYKNEYVFGIGSPASQSKIIENLIKLKIINENETSYCFDNKVKHMLLLLNKKLYDPDLPFRIAEWQNLDFDIAKDKIDRYIKTIFLKQKIKNKFIKI